MNMLIDLSYSEIAATILFIIGIFLVISAIIGVFLMQDFNTRLHAVSICETTGMIFILFGALIYSGFTIANMKIIFLIMFLCITNPLSTHIIAKAAFLFKDSKGKQGKND